MAKVLPFPTPAGEPEEGPGFETGPGTPYLVPAPAAGRTSSMASSQHERSLPSPVCVGRETELDRLAGLHRDAERAGERLVLVEGPSGSGKSRLLQELARRTRLDGGVVLEGRCDPGRAFGPFATIVDRALRFLDDMSLDRSVDLGDLGCSAGCHRFWHQHVHEASDAPSAFGEGSSILEATEAKERRMRFFDAVGAVLRDVSRVRAPLVLLHDLERADEGTLQLLRFLFAGSGPWTEGVDPTRSLHALFLASVAPGETRLDGLRAQESTTVMKVGKLDAEGVRALLQSETMVRRVLERTDGLPERIELLLEADPLSPQEALQRKLDELPEGAVALLEALSVLEHPADLDLLAQIVDDRISSADRQALARSGLVDQTILDGRILFAFARESQRQLAYEGIEASRRREMHRCCAALFAKERRREQAARHALDAGDFEQAVPMAFEDARALAARHAHAEAAALLERVLERSPEDAVPTTYREYLAELYRIVGEYRDALVHAEAVLVAQPDDAIAAHRVGRLLTLAGQLDAAAGRLEEAHDLAEEARVRVRVETSLAELAYQRGRYDEAQSWAERALEPELDPPEVALRIHARNTLGKVSLARKEALEAAAFFEENEAVAREAGLGHERAQALTNLGVARMREQRLADAKRCFEDAIEVARSVNDSREFAIATENLAVLAHLQRNYEVALASYHDAVSLLKRLGNRAMLARVGINLGELYLSLGDAHRAGALCDFAQHIGGQDLPPVRAGECLLLRGRVEMRRGEIDRSRASLEAAHDIFAGLRSTKVTQPLIELVRIALVNGEVAAARDILAGLPETASPKESAELAILDADLERAAGGDVLAAARRAVRAASAADDDELRLQALVRLTRAQCDAEDNSAAHTLHEAFQIEDALTSRVPSDARRAWEDRPTRAVLAELDQRVARVGGHRPSQPPPPRKRSAELDRRYPRIAGSCDRTIQLLDMLDKVAPSDTTVLVRGESGTGKELVAEALHRHSARADRPLVKVNCAALVETLLLSELFGHERGAFTGATARKKGRFELADGGTLFLDEIGDISPKTQVALLRVLQEREFERVGGTSAIRVDVRIIAATHRNLEQMVAEGTFREDLYYRLRGVSVEVAPLRARMSDLAELVESLLVRIAEERGEEPHEASPEVLELLGRHAWPGNVRELENVLRSATLFAEGSWLKTSDFAALGESFVEREAEPARPAAPARSVEDSIYDRIRKGDNNLLEIKKVIERECIARALVEAEGNITRAAELLGMKRPRLSQLVKQYSLGSYKKV